jgi:hypothetical protein
MRAKLALGRFVRDLAALDVAADTDVAARAMLPAGVTTVVVGEVDGSRTCFRHLTA